MMTAWNSHTQRETRRKFTVLDRPSPCATERVVALIRQILAKRSIFRQIGPDDDLNESGLSSLDIVNLMLAVEAEFDIKIPDREMVPSNFRSISRIEVLVGASLRDLQDAHA